MSNQVVGRRRGFALLTLLSLAFVAGCPGEETPTQTQTPSISVSIAPISGSVTQGSSTDIDVTVTGAGGFTGTATITLDAPPSGVSGVVGGVQSSGGITTATLTISVAGSVAPGSYTLTVRASGMGVTAVTATFALTVTAAPAYVLSATPAQLMIGQGAQGTTDIGIARTNFTGNVTLAAEGAPAGVTTSFGTNPVSGNASVLTVGVGASVTPGTYTLTIRGTATGLTDRTVAVTLVVPDPTAPAYMLDVSPSALSIKQGADDNATITITRSNFSGAVTLAAEGLPTDVSAGFSVNPVSGTTSEMTLTVAATVPTGSYTITVRGTATGLADRTATVGLTVEDASDYSLSLSPTAITIAQSGSGTVDVTLTRTNYTEAVTLSLENAPAGVTGSFNPNPATAGASVLTLQVGASVAAGDHTLTVRGTSASLSDRTTSLTLTVTPAQGFTLDPIAPLSVQQGSSGMRTVTLTRTGGFAGDVTVTVTDLPAGITASVAPPTTAGSSVDVTVTVAGSVAVGNYTGTVRGNATGQPEDTETLAISVTTAAGQQVSLDFSVCVASQRPVWLAYQDGSGPWTPVSGVGNTYTFNVASARAGIAVATEPSIGQSSVFVFYATQAEMVTADLEELCDFVATGKTVNASVSGINTAALEGATLTLGDSEVNPSADGPVTFMAVPSGNLDLVGYKWSFSGSPNRMILLRDLNPADGSNIGTLDFAGSSAFDPASAQITLTGGAGTGGLWYIEYATSPSSGVCYYAALDDDFYVSSPFTVRGAPVSQQQSGDFHVVSATDGVFYVSETFATLADRTIAFGPPLPTPTITDITGAAAYRRVRAELTLPSEYDSSMTLSLTDASGDRGIAVIATAAWLGGLAASVEIPDLAGLAGWNDTWAPTSSSTTTWGLLGYGWTGADCTEGAREVTAVTTGTVG